MKLTNDDVLVHHVDEAKQIMRGDWPGFLTTELFVLFANDEDVSAICAKYAIHPSKYFRRVAYVAGGCIR